MLLKPLEDFDDNDKFLDFERSFLLGFSSCKIVGISSESVHDNDL